PEPTRLTARKGVRDTRFETTNTKADVIFAFFGYNESFAGEAGLDKFKKDLDAFVKHALAQKYNGKSAPRLVLFSPTAFEDLGSPTLPGASETNTRLELYTKAMAEVAAANKVPFVDLFAISQKLHKQKPLTINGVHLTEYGNQVIAGQIDRALFGDPPGDRDAAHVEKLRR